MNKKLIFFIYATCFFMQQSLIAKAKAIIIGNASLNVPGAPSPTTPQATQPTNTNISNPPTTQNTADQIDLLPANSFILPAGLPLTPDASDNTSAPNTSTPAPAPKSSSQKSSEKADPKATPPAAKSTPPAPKDSSKKSSDATSDTTTNKNTPSSSSSKNTAPASNNSKNNITPTPAKATPTPKAAGTQPVAFVGNFHNATSASLYITHDMQNMATIEKNDSLSLNCIQNDQNLSTIMVAQSPTSPWTQITVNDAASIALLNFDAAGNQLNAQPILIPTQNGKADLYITLDTSTPANLVFSTTAPTNKKTTTPAPKATSAEPKSIPTQAPAKTTPTPKAPVAQGAQFTGNFHNTTSSSLYITNGTNILEITQAAQKTTPLKNSPYAASGNPISLSCQQDTSAIQITTSTADTNPFTQINYLSANPQSLQITNFDGSGNQLAQTNLPIISDSQDLYLSLDVATPANIMISTTPPAAPKPTAPKPVPTKPAAPKPTPKTPAKIAPNVTTHDQEAKVEADLAAQKEATEKAQAAAKAAQARKDAQAQAAAQAQAEKVAEQQAADQAVAQEKALADEQAEKIAQEKAQALAQAQAAAAAPAQTATYSQPIPGNSVNAFIYNHADMAIYVTDATNSPANTFAIPNNTQHGVGGSNIIYIYKNPSAFGPCLELTAPTNGSISIVECDANKKAQSQPYILSYNYGPYSFEGQTEAPNIHIQNNPNPSSISGLIVSLGQ